MAKKANLVEEVEVIEEPTGAAPRFRAAILGIRSLNDIKTILTTDEYDPHVHMLLLVSATFAVGALAFIVGA
jgi:hypothetical protein